MPLNTKKLPSRPKGERPEALDAGTYPVRLVQIIDLGLQKQRPFKGEEKAPAYEIMLTYEFLDEFMKDKETGEELTDKPRWLSEQIPVHSLESDLAKSTKRYYALDPSAEHNGDWSKLAGFPGMLTIVQNPSKKEEGVVYNNIAGLSTMRAKEAAKAPELVNPPKVFEIDNPDLEIFKSLPEWLQDKIKEGLEFDGSPLDDALSGSATQTSKDDEKATSEPVSESQDQSDGEDW